MDTISTIKVRKIVKSELDKIDGNSYDAKICTMLNVYQKHTPETSKVYQIINNKIDNLAEKIDNISGMIENVIGRA
jgi:hypothetical protein